MQPLVSQKERTLPSTRHRTMPLKTCQTSFTSQTSMTSPSLTINTTTSQTSMTSPLLAINTTTSQTSMTSPQLLQFPTLRSPPPKTSTLNKFTKRVRPVPCPVNHHKHTSPRPQRDRCQLMNSHSMVICIIHQRNQ